MDQKNDSWIASAIMLMRPFQYYKNLLIFIGIVFSKQLDQFHKWLPLGMGFIALCSVSSINYIINDLKDIEKDKKHPEKQNRPLASGQISKPMAYLLILGLLILTILNIFLMPVKLEVQVEFLFVVSAIFITSQLYSFYFKQIVFLDVTFIAINYVWRAVSGCVIIQVVISPWLILLPFLFALILALAKRKGALLLLGDEDKKEHRKVLDDYTIPLINQAISAVVAAMIVSYSLFTFEANSIVGQEALNPTLNKYVALMTIPLITFILLRFLFLLENGAKVSRKAELIFFDKQIISAAFIAGILLMISVFIDVSTIVIWFQSLPFFKT